MILVVDNYDSFAYNLVQYLGELGQEPVVYRNDAITLEEIEAMRPSHIVISPGPCTPLEAGISNDVIRRFRRVIPILGVCLGHQCIGYVYCGIIRRAALPVHGKESVIQHDGETIFRGLASPLTVLTHSSREAGMVAIGELTRQHKVARVVVGYPRSMDGTVGPQARRLELNVTELQQRLSVSVVLWDERLSTAEAERLIHESGRRVRRERIDAAAAAVILQSYLDAQSLADTASPAGD